MSETTIPLRRTTVTKHDVREHWKDKVSEAFTFCMMMFLSLLMFAVPTLVFKNFLLACVCAVLLLAETVAAGRMFFCIYKYGKV